MYDHLINALKLLTNKLKDGDSPVRMIVSGLLEKDRRKMMDGLMGPQRQEQETRSVSPLQSPQSLLRELGFLLLHSIGLRQNPNSRSLLVRFLLSLVELGLFRLGSTVPRQPRQLSLQKVAKSVGVGEARPPGFAKYSATSVSESEHVEI